MTDLEIADNERLKIIEEIEKMVAFWEGPLSRMQLLIALKHLKNNESEKNMCGSVDK